MKTVTYPLRQDQGDPQDEFDRFWGDDDTAAVSLDSLWDGPTTTPNGDGRQTGDIDLRIPTHWPSSDSSKSSKTSGIGESIRRFNAFMSKDRAPAMRAGFERLRSGGKNERRTIAPDSLTQAQRKTEQHMRDGAHELSPVTVTASGTPTRGLAGAIANVLATTQAGVNTPVENRQGEPGQFEEKEFQRILDELATVYNTADDPAKRRQAVYYIQQLNEQKRLGSLIHPKGLQGFLGGFARAATLGVGQSHTAYAARKALREETESGQAITPEDLQRIDLVQPERGDVVRETVPGASGSEMVGEFAGMILPFEIAERTAIKGMSAVARQIPRSGRFGKIGEAISGAVDFLETPVRADTDIGSAVKGTVQGGLRGQIGGGVTVAAEAALNDEDVGESLLGATIGNALLGGAFGAAGAGRIVPSRGAGREIGARISYARDRASRGTQDPPAAGALTDQVPSAVESRTQLQEGLEGLLQQRRSALTDASEREGSTTVQPEGVMSLPETSPSLVEQADVSKQLARQRTDAEVMELGLADTQQTPESRINDAAASASAARQKRRSKKPSQPQSAQAADQASQLPLELPALGEGETLTERLADGTQPRHVIAGAAGLGAANTEDEDTRKALLATGAVALGTEIGRLPKQFVGRVMRALREGDEVNTVAHWTKIIREATDNTFDPEPLLLSLSESQGTDALKRADVVPLIGDAAKKIPSPKDVSEAPAAAIIPWHERDNDGKMFFSRMQRAVEDMDYGGKKGKPASDWLRRLEDNPNFSKTELDWTIRSQLEERARLDPGMPFTKQDILDLIDDKRIEVGGVRHGTPGKFSDEFEAEVERQYYQKVSTYQQHRDESAHVRTTARDDVVKVLKMVGFDDRDANTFLDKHALELAQNPYNSSRAAIQAMRELKQSGKIKNLPEETDLPAQWKLVNEHGWFYVIDEHGARIGSGREAQEALLRANQFAPFFHAEGFDAVVDEFVNYYTADSNFRIAEEVLDDVTDRNPARFWRQIRNELIASGFNNEFLIPTRYDSYQRFTPRGEEYREHLIRLDAHGRTQREEFRSSHWKEPNLAAHYRAEIYEASPYRLANETEIADLRAKIVSVGEQMRALEQEMVARGVNRETGAGATYDDVLRSVELKTEYERAVGALNDALQKPSDSFESPKKTYVMVEAQSDWAQQGNDRGFQRYRKVPLTESEIEGLVAKKEVQELQLKELHHEINRSIVLQERLTQEMKASEMDARTRNGELQYRAFNQLVEANPTIPRNLLWDQVSRGEGVDAAERAHVEKLYAEANALTERIETVRREQITLYDRTEKLEREIETIGESIEHPDIENPYGVLDTPFAETNAWVGLATKAAIFDAIQSGAERFAWSSGESRRALAFLPEKAATLVYDQLIPQAIRKTFALLGETITFEDVGIGGYKIQSFALTPEIKQKVRRAGLPLLGTLAAVSTATQDADAQSDDAPDRNPFATIGGLAAAAGFLSLAMLNKPVRQFLAAEGSALLDRLLPRDRDSGLFAASALRAAKRAISRDDTQSWLVLHRGDSPKSGSPAETGTLIMRALEDADVPAQAFRDGAEYAIAVSGNRASGVLARIEQAAHERSLSLRGSIGRTYEAASAIARSLSKDGLSDELRGRTLYSNPFGPAFREMLRYPSALGVASLGYALTQAEDERMRRTGAPVIGLALLSALGSKRLGAMMDGTTDALVRQLRKTETGTRAVRFFNPERLLPRELQQAIVDFEEMVSKGRAKGVEMAKRSRRLGARGDRIVSDIIENEQWEDVSHLKPQQVRDVLTIAAQHAEEFRKLAVQKVTTGVLEPNRVLPDYAGPRRYAYYEAQRVNDARQGVLLPRRARIGPQRARILDLEIRRAQHALAEAHASGDPKRIISADNALHEALLRNLDARMVLGEIRESSYRAASGMQKGYTDVAAARLFQIVQAHPGALHPDFERAHGDYRAAMQLMESARSQSDSETAHVLMIHAQSEMLSISNRFRGSTGEYITLPNTPDLGALRGMVVQRDIANSINGLPDLKAWGTFLQFWKEAKTVFNPGTHVANVVSNISFAHMNGLSIVEQPQYLIKAMRDMNGYGPATRALAENGTLDVNAMNADARGVIARYMQSAEGLQELAATTRPETASVLRAEGIRPATRSVAKRAAPVVAGSVMGGAAGAWLSPDEARGEGMAVGAAAGAFLGSKAARDFSRWLYAGEDNVFRVAIYLRKIDEGMSPKQAADFAKVSLGNFRTRSPALHLLRGTVAPFVLYPAKAVPKFAELIIDHPWRYLALLSGVAFLDQLSQATVGSVNERDIALRDRNRLGYFFPGFTQLPLTGRDGEKAAVDVSRYFPTGTFTTVAPPGSFAGAVDERTSVLLSAGGPVGDVAVKFIGNRDPYTGKEIVHRDYPAADNARSIGEAIAGTMLPIALGFHRKRILEDVASQDRAALKNDLLGPLGLRPRYIRPGQESMNAMFQLRESVQYMAHEYQRALRQSKSVSRNRELKAQYVRKVKQAFKNYRKRVGESPPDDVIEEAEQTMDRAIEETRQ